MRGKYEKEYNRDFIIDKQQFVQSLYGEDNGRSRARLIRNLRIAIESELTSRQTEMIKLYYLSQMNMVEIAYELGINKSTVSRTLKRGRARLRRCLKFGAADLLREYQELEEE